MKRQKSIFVSIFCKRLCIVTLRIKPEIQKEKKNKYLGKTHTLKQKKSIDKEIMWLHCKTFGILTLICNKSKIVHLGKKNIHSKYNYIQK